MSVISGIPAFCVELCKVFYLLPFSIPSLARPFYSAHVYGKVTFGVSFPHPEGNRRTQDVSGWQEGTREVLR